MTIKQYAEQKGISPQAVYQQFNRVKSTSNYLLVIVLVYYLLVWSLLMTCPGFVAGLVTEEGDVYRCSITAIRVFFCLQFFMALQTAGQSTYTSLGMAKYALFFSLFRKAILVIPLVFILPNLFNLGVLGVFAAEPVSDVIGGTACFVTMMIATRKKLREGAEITAL